MKAIIIIIITQSLRYLRSLDELRELVSHKVRRMTRAHLQRAVEVGSGATKQKVHAVREEARQLGPARDALLVIAASAA